MRTARLDTTSTGSTLTGEVRAAPAAAATPPAEPAPKAPPLVHASLGVGIAMLSGLSSFALRRSATVFMLDSPSKVKAAPLNDVAISSLFAAPCRLPTKP